MPINRILERQLRNLGLDISQPPSHLADWQALLTRVSETYEQEARDQALVQRSMELSSREMQSLYDELRDRSAQQLAAERDQFEAIANGFPNGFCRLDRNGVVESANPVARDMLGKAVLGQSLLERFSPEIGNRDKRLSREEYIDLLESGVNCRFAEAMLEGCESWLLVTVLLYPIVQSGEITGGAFVFEDILKQRLAEVQRERLERAVESSTDSVFITDESGVIQYVNPAFTRITGWPREDAIGQTPGILKSGETPESVYQELWQTITAGHAWSGRVRNARRTDGEEHTGTREHYWVQLLVNPILRSTGEIQGYVAIQRDVSAEVAAEQRQERGRALANLRAGIGQRLQFATELSARLEMALADLVGNEQMPLGGWACLHGKQRHANKDSRARRLAQAGACPALPVDHFAPDLRELELLRLDGDGEGEGGGSCLITPLRSGRRLYGWLSTGLDESRGGETDSGSIPGWLGDTLNSVAGMMAMAIADEFARVEAEQAREAAIALARSKSEFLANMSHEIRTPMNGVLGMLDLLRESDLDAAQSESLEIAWGSAQSLLTIINDILDVSKIEAGKLHIEHVDYDLRSTIEEVCGLFVSPAEAKGLELVCHIPSATQTRVMGDPTRLRQVLSNLLGNAIKFTEHGEVVVYVEQQALSKDTVLKGRDGPQILTRIRVKDTGIGIDADKQARLFQPFSQADSSTTRQYGGTGLGLTISKQLAGLMQGSLSVESRSGEGAEFCLQVPLGLAGADADEQDDAKVLALLKGVRILAVEANASSREVLRDYLQGWQMQVQLVDSSAAAIHAFDDAARSGRPFEMVISAQKLGTDEGFALLSRLRQAEGGKAFKAALCCFNHLETGEVVDQVLRKPLSRRRLAEALQELVRLSHEPGSVTTRGAGIYATPPANASRLSGRALLVEDNLINQTVAVRLLERIGLSVDIADNGKAAVDKVQNEEFDVVIMDCQMPVMDGYEATRAIRELGMRQLPIIAMTANTMQGDRERCLDSGMDDYLGKPVKLDTLTETMQRWLPGAA